MRVRAIAIVAAAAAVLTAASGAHAHPERATSYPVSDVDSVPLLRTAGPSIVVCKADSATRIRRSWRGSSSTRRRARAARLALVDGCRFRHIQDAVDAAGNGTRILILPGVYREEPSRAAPVDDPRCRAEFEVPDDGDQPVATYRHHLKCPNARNLIAIIGDRDEDHRCDDKCGLQLQGMGRRPEDVLVVGDRLKPDVIRADRADGVVIANLAVEQGAFNGIDVVETNGFRLERLVARWSQAYGILSMTSDHGLYDRIEAYGNGDSGVYPGSGPEGHCRRYGIEVRYVDSHHNNLGMSGTAGNGTWVHHSRFHSNSVGISTDSVLPGHPGMPQDCSRYEDNDIFSNNLNPYGAENASYCSKVPFERRRKDAICPYYLSPVGTGIQLVGANANVIARNRIWDNWRWGTWLQYVPAAVRGENDPARQTDTSHDNRFEANVMGTSPAGAADRNGLDFLWDGEGAGNCWVGNSGAGGGTTTSDPDQLPACPGRPFSIGDPLAPRRFLTCLAWDPATNPNPPACDWYVTPEEPR